MPSPAAMPSMRHVQRVSAVNGILPRGQRLALVSGPHKAAALAAERGPTPRPRRRSRGQVAEGRRSPNEVAWTRGFRLARTSIRADFEAKDRRYNESILRKTP